MPKNENPPLFAAKAAKGGLWFGVARYFNFLVGFGSGIVLARLLKPEDFGVVALCTAALAILGRLGSIGVGEAIVQAKDENPVFLSTAFWLQAMTTIIIWLIAIAVLRFAGLFSPLAARIFFVLACFQAGNLLLFPMGQILRRRFDFKRLSLVEIAVDTPAAAISLLLAWRGFGPWALVWPAMCSLLAKGLLIWALSGWLPRLRFEPVLVRTILGLSPAYLAFSVLEEMVHRTADLVIGRLGGRSLLGYYSRAFNLAEMYTMNIASAANSAAFPLFCRLMPFPQELERAFSLLARVFLFGASVVYCATGVLAPELIHWIFGDQWLPVVPLFRAILPYAIILPVFSLSSSFLVSIGRIKSMVRVYAVMTAVLIFSLIFGLRIWGIIAAPVAMDAMVLAGMAYLARELYRYTGIRILKHLRNPLAIAVLAGIVLAVLRWSTDGFSPMMRPLAMTAASITVFPVLVIALDRKLFREDFGALIRVLRSTIA